jgi:hypothetical protein
VRVLDGMTSKTDARPDERARRNTWQNLFIGNPALDTGDDGTEFLIDLMYMFAGVYTTSKDKARLQKILWNIFPFLSHCTLLVLFIVNLSDDKKIPFMLKMAQILMLVSLVLNSVTFYRSRRLGSVSRDVPRKTLRAAFVSGIPVCLVMDALYVWTATETLEYLPPNIASIVFVVPVTVYQLVMILMLVRQFRRFNTSFSKHLDALVEGNDADVVHTDLVKGNEVSFAFFRKHIAEPFLTFFFFSIAAVAFCVVYLYAPHVDELFSQVLIVSFMSLYILTCAMCLFIFVEIDQNANVLHRKLLKNRTMRKADLACLLIVFEHLIPRAEILGAKVTVGIVAAMVVPVVSAVVPKVFEALVDFSSQ